MDTSSVGVLWQAYAGKHTVEQETAMLTTMGKTWWLTQLKTSAHVWKKEWKGRQHVGTRGRGVKPRANIPCIQNTAALHVIVHLFVSEELQVLSEAEQLLSYMNFSEFFTVFLL